MAGNWWRVMGGVMLLVGWAARVQAGDAPPGDAGTAEQPVIAAPADPAKAPSDGPNQLPLARLEPLLGKLKKIHELVRDGPERLSLGMA